LNSVFDKFDGVSWRTRCISNCRTATGKRFDYACSQLLGVRQRKICQCNSGG